MKRLMNASLMITILTFGMILKTWADPVQTTWGGSAEDIYDNGFMHMLMKHPDSGISLFDMDLIENDAPGAGYSEKGVNSDNVWGKNIARKWLYLDDPRAKKAYVVFFFARRGKYPLKLDINKHSFQIDPWDPKTCHLPYRWFEFPAEWLKKGRNVIDLSCPEAESVNEGWGFYLARADEFEHGGGDPKDVGKTSFKSTNGGESWKESPFGPLGQTRAEYTVRISFDRSVKTGWLATPVIDLWRGDDTGFIVPVRVFKKMRITIRADVPDETSIEYYIRKGISPGPLNDDWSPYEALGSGPSVDVEFDDRAVDGRFIQLRAVLSTVNPLKTPVLKSIDISADLMEGMPLHESIKVAKTDNPVIRYSSVDWEWEKWDRPELNEIRKRENLDGVTDGSKTQFERIVRLLEYATTRVTRKYGNPLPHYPGWDVLSIAERIDRHGSTGMCIQFNNYLNGLCMAYGMQGRLINGMNHEMAEVWSDDYGKWVYLEASYGNMYLVDKKTGVPMSLLEVHNAHLDYFFPERPIDWLNELTSAAHSEQLINEREDKPPVLRSSTTYHQNDTLAYKGFTHSPFMRMMPRNNYYEKPYPMPLTHGVLWWHWNSYINWYDERTPRKRQYTWYTDRPRDMWPDLNLVHIDATSAHNNKYLFLQFETYSPNFSHFDVDENDTGWKRIDSNRWTWVLASGKNTLRVRTVNKLGANGKPSTVELYRADVPLKDLY
ncbi:transglutaminase-like domain-containing protein [Candidatus Omnitrophota bacterium]